MKFDSILSEIDGFGKFQIRLVLVQILSRVSLPCHFLLNNFMAAVPSHHCNLTALGDGGIFGNLTQEQKLSVGVPAEQDGTLSSCQMFSNPQYQHLSSLNRSEDAATIQCRNGWVFDNSTYKSTLATEVSVFNKQYYFMINNMAPIFLVIIFLVKEMTFWFCACSTSTIDNRKICFTLFVYVFGPTSMANNASQPCKTKSHHL